MSVLAAEARPRPSGGLQWLERLGLSATRALSALGLSALLFLAVLTLVDGLARWLLNQPIEGVRDVAAVLNDDARIDAYVVESENFESIHNHSAYALIERDKRTA